jgi:chemotaxis protein MotB
VAFYLITLGAVAAQHCTVMGYADTQPLVPNNSEAHRARNRRVEIAIRPLDSPAAETPTSAPTVAPTAAPAAAPAAKAAAPGTTAAPGASGQPSVSPKHGPAVDIRPHLDPAGSPTKEEH